MRRIVIAALLVALGAFGLALGLSAADAVERAVVLARDQYLTAAEFPMIPFA